jgi:hypothetical protein
MTDRGQDLRPGAFAIACPMLGNLTGAGYGVGVLRRGN